MKTLADLLLSAKPPKIVANILARARLTGSETVDDVISMARKGIDDDDYITSYNQIGVLGMTCCPELFIKLKAFVEGTLLQHTTLATGYFLEATFYAIKNLPPVSDNHRCEIMKLACLSINHSLSVSFCNINIILDAAIRMVLPHTMPDDAQQLSQEFCDWLDQIPDCFFKSIILPNDADAKVARLMGHPYTSLESMLWEEIGRREEK